MSAGAAVAADLQVSQYSLTPDPVPHGGTTTFQIRLTNNGSTAVTDATLQIGVSSKFEVQAVDVPTGCTLAGAVGAQTLTCAMTLPAGSSTFSYLAHADTIGSADTTASISSPTAADPNPANDSLTITPAVISGADLSITKTDGLAPAHQIGGGGTISYVVTVSNAGPDSTNAVVMTDQLPSTADFQFASASGTGWTCTNSGTTVTCTYNGASLVGTYAPVTITGQVVRATTGTIINNASVALNSPLVGDKNLDNNKVDPGVQTAITGGTDLQALKTMPASIFIDPAQASSTVTIGANNTGPQPVTDATVTDAIPSNLAIDSTVALPSGCTQAGQTITCHTGALPVGSQRTFDIKVRGVTQGIGLTNTATVTAPAGIVDPNSANDSQTRTFQVQAPGADFSIFKTKLNANGTTDPIKPGDLITNNIRLFNNGPSVATFGATGSGTQIRFTDQLGPDETYVSVSGGWNCAVVGTLVTCTRFASGTTAVGASLPVTLTTMAGPGANGVLTNTACTGTTAGSQATPADPFTGDDCVSASLNASSTQADLAINKTVSLAPGSGYVSTLDVPGGTASFYIKLVATNNGPATSTGVTVTDKFAGMYQFSGSPTTFNLVDASGNPVAPGNVTIAADGTITWTIASLAAGAGNAQTLIVRANRPFETGTALAAQVNTATIKSSDIFDPVSSNNTSSASYTLHPVADITVTQKTVTPTSTQTGVSAIYTISTKNNGPNFAENVVVEDVIDTTKFDLIGDPTTTKSDGTCSIIPGSGTSTVHCDLGTYQYNQSYQVVQSVRPRYPFGTATTFPQSNTNTATITTTSFDSVTSNNSKSVTHNVTGPVYDLSISKQEPGPEYDPIAYGLDLTYDIRVSNFGPSRANNVVVVDTPAPPSGYTMTFHNFTVNDVAATSGLALYTPPAPNCVAVGATVQCRLDAGNSANNFLDPLKQTIFRVRFTPAGAAPTSPLTFTDTAAVTATEQPTTTTPVADTQLANNTATQTTTVLPSADLEVVSKTRVTASPVASGTAIQYKIVIANDGPSPTTQVRVTDQLPAGLVMTTPAATFQVSGSTTVTSMSCTGTNTILCVLNGTFPPDPGHASTVAITINAVASDPYSGPTSTDLTNTATIAPGQDSGGNPLSGDSNSANNSKTATVQISAPGVSSIAGTVFADANRDDAVQAGEGLAGVTILLQKSDGTAVASTVTGADGSFLFSGLAAGAYQLVEQQPANYHDWHETAGTAGGTVNNTAFDSTVAHNSITAITLPANTVATGYLFQEVADATVSGTIYADANNDGVIEAGETGFPPSAFASSPQLSLTGTDYAGNAVNLTATVSSTGTYSFANVPPSDLATGYTVTELVQPTGTVDGKDSNGPGLANVVAGSSGRAAPEGIAIGTVAPGASLTDRNFGELVTATLTGSIFLDPNGNAIRDASETTGLANGTVTLSFTPAGGTLTSCSITTLADGSFSFPNSADSNAACHTLPTGTYTLTETPPPGFTHVGVFIGTAGGTAGGTTGANTPAVGAGNLVVSNIALTAGATASRYDFGEKGKGMLSGYVYVDRNGNGTRDTGETGIAGVTVTLSGNTSTGQPICAAVAVCTTTTDAAGNFSFSNLPASDATGYTLTETQPAGYADGADGAGTIGGTPHGTAGGPNTDVITGIVMAATDMGTNYRFGEGAGSVAGHVFVDANNTGIFQAGSDTPLAGITLTLSGTTGTSTDICTQRAALSPALSCTTTTASDGTYSFGDLPAGTYTLTETQPATYVDGKEGAGAPAGTVNNAANSGSNTIATIGLGAGVAGTGYDFGETGLTLSGRVFKDPQRDGVDGGGEPGIAGVTVQLLQGATVVATTTTKADGSYSFPGLSTGSYTVQETQPAGYGSSSPDTVAVTLSTANQTVNFADTVSTIAGSVFIDGNNDGVRQSGEAGIANVSVKLTGTDAAGNAVSRTAVVTDASGNFSFGDLLSGTYTLTETQPAGYADGLDSAGTAGGTVANDVISAIALPTGTDATKYGFGERGVSLTGIVYLDSNLSGHQDSGEPGIAGVTVTLRDNTGATVGTTTTGSDGSYSFTGIGAGTYTVVETQPLGYGEAVENAGDTATVTIGATSPTPVNFGERAGSIAGLVYNDSNQNGRHESTEPPIAGVTVTLTGTDLNGLAVSQTTVTGADGSYKFSNVVGGTYALAETQPAAYQDGIDTPGTSGGTAAPVGSDLISNIVLGPAQDATGYLFGEHGPGAQLSGSVWFDTNHDGARNAGEVGKAGWTVQLFQSGVLVGTTTTDANGEYNFTDLMPGSGYSILFRAPVSQAAFGSARPNETGMTATDGVVSTGNPAGASFSTGQLMGLTLAPGANIVQQSLPLDPSGVIYDSLQRTVIAGATIKITGPAGFDPATQLLGGTINASQTVGSDGIYQFLLLPGAPNGVYTLTVTPPSGGSYNPITPSTIIPPCTGPLTVGPTPAPLVISTYDGAPPTAATTGCAPGGSTTAYYLSFTLTAGISADVVNNNIPIDPIVKGAIVVTKTTPMTNVTRGGLVPYQITARNALAGAVPNIAIVDRVPAGFRYRAGSARMNGAAVTPVENGQLLTFPAVTFAASETKTIQLILAVGAGVGDGEHVNQAYAVNSGSSTVISNVAEATVRIEPDADFDCSDVLGKVFDDKNGNGYEDQGEPGLPGVRVATVAGDLITTDKDGRYHITCPQIPNADRGSNFILKLDPRTLPTGYRLTTENPETVRLTSGKFVKLNFGAALMRVVRLDVRDTVFDGEQVAPDYVEKVDTLVTTLEDRPSVLRIYYAAHGEDTKVIRKRVAVLKAMIEHKWADIRHRCRLIVEVEEGR